MVRKAKKKKLKMRILLSFLLMVVIAIFAYKYIITPGTQHLFEKYFDDKTTLIPLLKTGHDSAVSISSDRLNSPHAILIRLKDQTILMQKNSEEKIYPASLTKMMTAIIAIENLPNLQEEIKLPNSMFKELYNEDATMAGFQPDEKVRAVDLLFGALLPSGAECCVGLADQIAGSEQNFAKIMNQKAADLGMNNTHFENATGLHDENH